MAGLGAKLFTDGSVLNAEQVNGYLMDQSIMRFATTAARDAAFGGVGEPTLAEGMFAYIDADNTIYTYDGSNWVKMISSSTPVGLERITACTVTSVGGTAATASNGVITIGTGNTSIVVANAFSSEYQSYRIFIENENTNGTASHDISLNGIATSTYYVAGHYFSWTVAGGTTAYAPAPNTTFIVSANVAAGVGSVITMDIHNPNIARRKYGYFTSQVGNGSMNANIYSTSSAVATGFTLSKSGDTMTGGTIRVYGYRN